MKIKDFIEVLKNADPDREIYAQVAANDGKAWSMFWEFIPEVPGSNFMSAIILRHPKLKTLPEGEE